MMENCYNNNNDFAACIQKSALWQANPPVCEAGKQKLPKKWSRQDFFKSGINFLKVKLFEIFLL